MSADGFTDSSPAPSHTTGTIARVNTSGRFNCKRDIERFREAYLQEMQKDAPSPQAQFELAWCLTCSSNRGDLREGIELLQELIEAGYNRLDCIYYIALAHFRLGEYAKSRRRIEMLLRMQPNHRQGLSLQSIIVDKITTEGSLGIAIFASLAVGMFFVVRQVLKSNPYD
eukprot:GILJ01003586.1.p1 GENE.GILJ01003586.1~~GILJ01003586.1.p1  ORF type:complete len:189 (+),score=14.44 GILJ01003586.1:59-568(+)